MATREGEHVWDIPQYVRGLVFKSQEGECVARAAPACQISAAVHSIANQHGLQVSLHHWTNERIHQHEEKLSAWADQRALKSVSFTRGDADRAGNGSGHRQSLASKAAFGKLKKRTFWKAAGVLPGLVSEPLHLWSTGWKQQLNAGWAFNQINTSRVKTCRLLVNR